MADIRAETAYGGRDLRTFEFADLAWKLKQFQGLFKCDVLEALAFVETREEGFLIICHLADLHHWPETADLDRYAASCGGIRTQYTFADFMLHAHGADTLDEGMKLAVKVFELGLPGEFALGYVIEFLPDTCREAVVENVGEIFRKEFVDYHADIRRHEFAPV